MQLWSQRSGQRREFLQAPRYARAGTTLGGKAVQTHPTRRPRLQVRLEDKARRTFSGPPPTPPCPMLSPAIPQPTPAHTASIPKCGLVQQPQWGAGGWDSQRFLGIFWNRGGGSQHGPDLHPLLTSPGGFASGNLQPLRNPAAASPCCLTLHIDGVQEMFFELMKTNLSICVCVAPGNN